MLSKTYQLSVFKITLHSTVALLPGTSTDNFQNTVVVIAPGQNGSFMEPAPTKKNFFGETDNCSIDT